MHSELFYIGIEAGFQDEMRKEAIIGAIRRGLGRAGEAVGGILDKGDDLLMSGLSRGMASQNPVVRKASNLGFESVQDMTRRSTINPGIAAGMQAGPDTILGGSAVGTLDAAGSMISDAAGSMIAANPTVTRTIANTGQTLANTGQALATRQGRRELAGAAMRGAQNAVNPQYMTRPPAIVRSVDASYPNRAQRLQQLGVAYKRG